MTRSPRSVEVLAECRESLAHDLNFLIGRDHNDRDIGAAWRDETLAATS
jgi:hypothetical protein